MDQVKTKSDELTDLEDDGSVDWRRLLRQSGVGLALGLVIVAGLAVVLQGPITSMSESFIARTGLWGLFFGVVFVDVFHLTHEPILLAAHLGGVAFWTIGWVASVASYIAAPIGWAIGRWLGTVPRVRSFLERHRLDKFLQRYGFWAVAIAALTPIPYAATNWAAGAAGVSFRVLMLGALFRVFKVLIWLVIVVEGWELGSAF